MGGHLCITFGITLGHLIAGPVRRAQRRPVGDVAQRAKGPARVVGPGRQFVRGVDEERVVSIQVIEHRRRARRYRRFAAGHELHQRQALAFTIGGVDHVAGGLDQALVIRIRQVAIDQHDAAAVRLVFVQVMKDVGQRFLGIVVGQFEHQGRVLRFAEGHAEGTEHVFPILAPVAGVEHRGVDHAVEDDLVFAGRRLEIDALAAAQVLRAEGLQIELTAVRHHPFDLQRHLTGQRLTLQLRATGGETVPHRRGHGDDRIIRAHRLAHGVNRVAGVRDGRA